MSTQHILVIVIPTIIIIAIGYFVRRNMRMLAQEVTDNLKHLFEM